MLNKKNINHSANAISDKFIWETMVYNILSL